MFTFMVLIRSEFRLINAKPRADKTKRAKSSRNGP